MLFFPRCTATFLCLVSFIFASPCAAGEVNLYSARKSILIEPLLEKFTAATGIAVNLLSSKADALIRRLDSEGENTPADLLLLTDVARLYRAKQMNLLRPLQVPALNAAVAARYRDPQGYWFGLSLRHRVFVYAPDRVQRSELRDYLDLEAESWRGRLCVRSSDNVYNQSLVASLLAHHGVDRVETWAQGLVANFARPPVGGDRDQIRAVAAGQCDLAVVNNYYLAGMLHSSLEGERKLASTVRLFWPGQEAHGAHVNISGAGVARFAKHPDAATQLLQFLVGDVAQRWFATVNHEYPVRRADWTDTLSETQRAWGIFQADTLDMDALGAGQEQAVRVMDRAGWQ